MATHRSWYVTRVVFWCCCVGRGGGGEGWSHLRMPNQPTTRVQVVHCLTSDCSKASVTNTGHALAQYSSTVVISPETGFPVIASLSDGNVGNVNVQTVACLNADCSSSKLSSHGSAPAQLETRVQSAVRPDGRLTLAWIGPYGSTEPYEPV